MDVHLLAQKAGGVGKFALLLGVRHSTICDWKRSGYIPAGRLPRISRALNIPLDTMWPLVRPSAETDAGRAEAA